MSETLTGRARLRPHRQYEQLLLVLQVEERPVVGTDVPCFWRDATVEDIAVVRWPDLVATSSRPDIPADSAR